MNTVHDATFAGGCFWCMEPPFDKTPGVLETIVGYTGGHQEDPTYEEVTTGKTGHVEAVRVRFDPTKVSYEKLLEVFWRNIDPTQTDGQFADRGSHYRTFVFYHSEEQRALAERSKTELSKKFTQPIATQIAPATAFYGAEDYHQEYYKKNPTRYKLYKLGSGRQDYIAKQWGE